MVPYIGKWKDAPFEGSSPVSSVVMDRWAKEVEKVEDLTQTLAEINPVQYEPLKLYLLSKYIDNVLTAKECMKIGVRWPFISKTFIWSLEDEMDDRKNGISPEECTMREFTKMASCLTDRLEFTWDAPFKHSGGKMQFLTPKSG